MDPALGRICSAVVRRRAAGEPLEHAWSAIKCPCTDWVLSPDDGSRVASARPAPVVVVRVLLLLDA